MSCGRTGCNGIVEDRLCAWCGWDGLWFDRAVDAQAALDAARIDQGEAAVLGWDIQESTAYAVEKAHQQRDEALLALWVNLTPHAIGLRLPDMTDLVLPPSGQIARVEEAERQERMEPGVPVPVLDFPRRSGLIGLPQADGRLYVVSILCLQECAGRNDVYAPATGPRDGAIRENGQIVAVTRLIAAPTG